MEIERHKCLIFQHKLGATSFWWCVCVCGFLYHQTTLNKNKLFWGDFLYWSKARPEGQAMKVANNNDGPSMFDNGGLMSEKSVGKWLMISCVLVTLCYFYFENPINTILPSTQLWHISSGGKELADVSWTNVTSMLGYIDALQAQVILLRQQLNHQLQLQKQHEEDEIIQSQPVSFPKFTKETSNKKKNTTTIRCHFDEDWRDTCFYDNLCFDGERVFILDLFSLQSLIQNSLQR